MITRIVIKPGSERLILADGEVNAEFTNTIVSDNASDTDLSIGASKRIPKEGSRIRGGICTSSEVARIDSLVWENIIRYRPSNASFAPTPTPTPPENPDDPKNPANQPTEIRWASKRIEKFTGRDANRKAILNSAGEPLQDCPPVEIYHAVVTLSRFETKYNPMVMGEYAGKLNSRKWFLCPPLTAKAEWPEATLINDANGEPQGWRVSYSFEIAMEGWVIQIPDRGHFVKKDVSPGEEGVYKDGKQSVLLARDANGVANGELIFLDGKGKALSQKRIDARNPVLLDFMMYNSIDFNKLGLP